MFADLRLTRTASSAPPTTPPTGGWPPRSSTQSSTSCLRPRARRSTIPAGASPASAPSSREAAAGSAPTLLRRSGTAAGRPPRSDASHLSSSLECNVTSGRDLPTSTTHLRVWLLPVHQTYRCVFRGGFVPNNGSIGENGAEPSDACRRGRFS